MSCSPVWLNSKIASTATALKAGDGCHPEEAQALSDYLHNSITAEQAAERITSHLLNEPKPAEETYRVWALICEALVELNPKYRPKILKLLSQIQTLPPKFGIQWAELPGFASMWATLYRLHLHGPDGWENEVESLDEGRVHELRQHFEAVGRVEAEMLVRGFDAVTSEHWGFEVLDLVCSDRAGLDIFLSQVLAWLEVAGHKLRDKAQSEETSAERWTQWKQDVLRLSQEGRGLSNVGRGLAAQCYELM
jgi:hypothetical protein